MSLESRQQDDPRDLSKVIPNEVVSNQQAKKGQAVLIESDGLLHQVVLGNRLALADRYSNRVRGELEWFEKFVGHGPSVGAFHEHLIRMAITDVLPSRFKLGEGFVYDSNRELCSKQLDLIVYSDHDIRQLAMEEIAARFPKEKRYLQELKFGDRKPFGAIVHARTDLLALGSVAELTAQKGFQWVTAKLPPP
jgi:hypothetical protein